MTLLVKISENTFRVHPMPTWSDYLQERRMSSCNAQYSLPLQGIFFLEQSDSDEVLPLSPGDASLKIFESCKQAWNTYWNRLENTAKKQIAIQVFDNSIKLAKSIQDHPIENREIQNLWRARLCRAVDVERVSAREDTRPP